MRVPRPLSLALLASLAAPWAITLTVFGLWMLLVAPGRWPGLGLAAPIAGITSLAAGQLVFSACVADRLFPRAARTIGLWVELISCLVLLAGCVFLAVAAGLALLSSG